jgi:hypothetical protein
MATGISSGAWGYSPKMVAGINNSMEYQNIPLTYQLSLTSTPVNNKMSPLTAVNKSYYYKNAFGSKKELSATICEEFIRSNGTVNPFTGRPIKPNGPTYKQLIQKCKDLENPPLVTRPATRSTTKPQPGAYERFSVVYEDCDSRDPVIKKLTLNGKKYTRGTTAFYNSSKNQGIIKGMGCKQINIVTPDNREKHVNLEKFFEYNY